MLESRRDVKAGIRMNYKKKIYEGMPDQISCNQNTTRSIALCHYCIVYLIAVKEH